MTGFIAASILALATPGSAEVRAHGVEVAEAEFRGLKALQLRHRADPGLALIEGVAFRNGEISIEVAGMVDPDASLITRHFARGFIGVAFRVQTDGASYEKIYLRPTNARADDQLRRNHTTQYSSPPEHPWKRLREEAPGRYESYVDMQPGVWTMIRIVVAGETARLFVAGAEQPCLVVHDLKLGEVSGGIGLYVGSGTLGYFRNLRVVSSDAGGS